MKKASLANLLITSLALLTLGSCQRQEAHPWQGYLEGEFVYVAAPLGGQLSILAVARGDRVDAGAVLFTLEHEAEAAGQRQANDHLRAAQSRLNDLRKGSRPSELASLSARLEQTRTAAKLSATELARQKQLHDADVTSAENYDRARLTHEKNLRAVDELEAQLTTARLGARSDTIAAAEAEVSAATAALAQAAWRVNQKSQSAAEAAFVFDTLYRPGEFVVAGRPVVVLLPPANIKVRFFVPETILATLQAGDHVHVQIDGRPEAVEATINYLSPQAEFTPPVLYNRENRAKLVYMVEARLEPAIARELRPGQPVDVLSVR